METTKRHIIEDLLPLYAEGLLSAETTKWLEAEISGNEEYKELVRLSREPVSLPAAAPPANYDRMMRKINRKLSLYQMVFVALSFYLAIRTSLLNDSFGFILWYAVLGLLTYLFYRDMKIVLLVAVLPILIWSLGSRIAELYQGHFTGNLGEWILQTAVNCILMIVIHSIFLLIGSLMAYLLIGMKKGEENK